MDDPIPWKAPATIGFKRQRETEYQPEIAGLTLNQALDHATDPRLPAHTKVCIWVIWNKQEVMISGRRIFQLAEDPERPPLPDR